MKVPQFIKEKRKTLDGLMLVCGWRFVDEHLLAPTRAALHSCLLLVTSKRSNLFTLLRSNRHFYVPPFICNARVWIGAKWLPGERWTITQDVMCCESDDGVEEAARSCGVLARRGAFIVDNDPPHDANSCSTTSKPCRTVLTLFTAPQTPAAR